MRYNQSLLQLVRDHADEKNTIVDFGAGIGTFAFALCAEGYSVQCVEPDPGQAKLIRERGLPVVESLGQLPPRSADVIYTFNVLEHIEDDRAVLSDLLQVLKPHGLLIVYVPAFPILYSSMDDKVGHVRRYRRSELKSKLGSAGFAVKSICFVDSIGFLASLAYRLVGDNSGDIGETSVALYDRWVFPVSRVTDRVLHRVVGKNLVAVASRPGSGDAPSFEQS